MKKKTQAASYSQSHNITKLLLQNDRLTKNLLAIQHSAAFKTYNKY